MFKGAKGIPKGTPKPPNSGRAKGTPNKIPSLLKDAIIQSAIRAGHRLNKHPSDKEQEGLIKYLSLQAEINPGPFMHLLGKILPIQLQDHKGNDITNDIARIERVIVTVSRQTVDVEKLAEYIDAEYTTDHPSSNGSSLPPPDKAS